MQYLPDGCAKCIYKDLCRDPQLILNLIHQPSNNAYVFLNNFTHITNVSVNNGIDTIINTNLNTHLNTDLDIDIDTDLDIDIDTDLDIDIDIDIDTDLNTHLNTDLDIDIDTVLLASPVYCHLTGYDIFELCTDCILNTYRNCSIIQAEIFDAVFQECGFDALIDIAHAFECQSPKETLFKYYVEQCKINRSIEHHKFLLEDLLSQKIDMHFQFTTNVYKHTNIEHGISMFRQSPVARHICEILKLYGYQIFDIAHNRIKFTNLVNFIVVG
jgi:hypothetical protein